MKADLVVALLTMGFVLHLASFWRSLKREARAALGRSPIPADPLTASNFPQISSTECGCSLRLVEPLDFEGMVVVYFIGMQMSGRSS